MPWESTRLFSVALLDPREPELEVLCDEDPQDLVDVLRVVVVDGVGVVARLVPHGRERRHDQVQDGHVCNATGGEFNPENPRSMHNGGNSC